MTKSAAIIIFCLLQTVSFGEMRIWHSIDGTRFVGEYEAERLDRYYFRDENGKTRTIPVKDLVPNDERYIRTIVPPEIKVDFRKKAYIPQGTYADKDVTVIDGQLEIRKIGRKPFYGKLRGELCYVGEEVATDHYMMLAKKKFSVEFPDSENPTVDITLRAEARVYEEYNHIQMRGRNYEGYAVFIFSSTGELIAFDTDLSWLTKENLEAFRQLDEFNFFNESCQKQRVPRPKYYVSRGYMP